MPGAIAKAEEIVASDPERYFLPQQFKNPANPAIHECTTGPEIWDDTDGNVDVLVAGVGHGRHDHRRLALHQEDKGKPIISVAVEPAGSPVLTQARAGQPLKPGPHKIQGIGAGFIPEVLDLSLVDRVEQVTNEEAIECARRLAREEGISAASRAARRWRRRSASRARSVRGQDYRGHHPGLRGEVSHECPVRRNSLKGPGAMRRLRGRARPV